MSEINKKICNLIAEEWISKAKSNRAFALDHNIDEKTVRKILQKDGYEIPLITLIRICEAKEMKLSTFFKLLNI
ncbi:transcriptional regulator [Seonamhaeicola sp.]|uniref:transcriptional regulator n=1 Tax=Seonamhaeicola sp. TaxID=1912245 RepID=UPI00356AC11E